MSARALSGGFADPPRQSAWAFRALMNAMARPGHIAPIEGTSPPLPLSPAAGAALLVLCDPDTPVYLATGHDQPEIREWLSFHTGAPLAPAEAASFALGTWEALIPLSQYPIGTAEYPDRSTTLIVECAELRSEGTRLTGPGIETEAVLNLPDPALFAENAARFPLGLDFFFSAGTEIAALPRSTTLRIPEVV